MFDGQSVVVVDRYPAMTDMSYVVNTAALLSVLPHTTDHASQIDYRSQQRSPHVAQCRILPSNHCDAVLTVLNTIVMQHRMMKR